MNALFQLRSNKFSTPILKEKLLKGVSELWGTSTLDEEASKSVLYITCGEVISFKSNAGIKKRDVPF